MKFNFFVISKKQWHQHHPNKEAWPNWVLHLPQSLHMVVNAIQRLKADDENLAIIRSFLDSIEYEYLSKRRMLDETENNHYINFNYPVFNNCHSKHRGC